MLRDRNERHGMFLERVDRFREVRQRASQAIDFVNDHAIDRPTLDVGHELFQCRAFEVCSREAPIVVMLGNNDPTLLCLSPDEMLGGLTLGVERIEIAVESLLGGFCACKSRTGFVSGFADCAVQRAFTPSSL